MIITYISFHVNAVSQFLNAPCDSHWYVVVQILRCIKGLPGKGLIDMDKGQANTIVHRNANWERDASDRRSTIGYCVFIGGDLILWKSKKQI